MSEDVKVEEVSKKEKSKKTTPWYWMRNDKGNTSITATMVFISFWVTTLAYLASAISKIGSFEIREFDVAACSAYFVPILTLYFGRKWTDAKNPQKSVDGPGD
jgi:hypothetical protein